MSLGGDRRDWTSDQVIRSAAVEIEAHVAASGWDQPARLYALVPTSELLVAEPALAARLGLDTATASGFTPIEQDDVPIDRPLEETLHRISWPPQVVGCAAAVERLVQPAAVEVRIVAAATRDGRAHCALRMRAHDDDSSVLTGADLVPGLLTLLWETLAD